MSFFFYYYRLQLIICWVRVVWASEPASSPGSIQVAATAGPLIRPLLFLLLLLDIVVAGPAVALNAVPPAVR